MSDQTTVQGVCVCGTRVRMGLGAAGTRVPCMACGAVVQLPAAGEMPPNRNEPPAGLSQRYVAPPPDKLARYRETIQAVTDHARNIDFVLAAAEASTDIGYRYEAFLYYERAYTLDPGRTGLRQKLRQNAMTPEQQEKVARWEKLPPSFAHAIGDALYYPFRGAGFVMILFGAIILWGVEMMVQLSAFPWASWTACLVLMGYLAAFNLRILGSTAIGEDDIPHWPDFTDLWSVAADFFKFWFAYLWSFIPLVVLGLVLLAYTIAAAVDVGNMGPGGGPSPEAVGVAILFMLCYGAFFGILGILYLPMATMANAIFNWPFACVNPAFILRSIWSAKFDYFLCTIGYFIIAILVGVPKVIAGLHWIVFLATLLPISFIVMYGTVVQMRLLGLFFRYNQGRMGWLIEKS